MRVAIREQLAALVLFAVLLSLAIISIPTWIFVHNFVVDVESDGLALTASLKASAIASELALAQTICQTVATRILLQQAFIDFYNQNSTNKTDPFANARADLESAMGTTRGLTGLLQARLYSRNSTGDGHRGLLSVTGAGVGNATNNIELPYLTPDGSRVNLSDTEYGYPLSLYPNITYTNLGYPNPYVPSTPAFGAYAFPNVNLSTGGGLVLGPLVINETFALISLTIPIRSYAISNFILGYMTLVISAGSLAAIQQSPEGLGSTGVVLLVGPANPSNRFNVSQPASNDTYSPTQPSFKNTPVRFVIPPIPVPGQSDRHPSRSYHSGNYYGRPFPLRDYPSLTKVYTRKLSPLNNSTVSLSTTNEEGVPVAVAVARPATTLVNWAVVVEKAKSEAYQPIDKLRDILLGCVFGTAGLIAILVFPCAHLSVMSIRRLKAATEKSINPPGYEEYDDAYDEEHPSSGATSSKRSDKGFFAAVKRKIWKEKRILPISEAEAHRHVFKIPGRVEVGKHFITDELTELTETFNDMTDELLKQYTQLEDKVAERTRELEVSKRAAEAANESKTLFIANISHELKTPLNGIMGMCAVCMEEDDIVRIKQSLKTLYRSGDLLLHLLEDLLSFSKNQIGQHVSLEEREFRLGDIKSQMLSIFDKQVRESNITFTVSFLNSENIELRGSMDQALSEKRLPALGPNGMGRLKDVYVWGDQHRILQVMINLVNNSLKFTPSGGKVELRIRCVCEVERLETDVSRTSSLSKGGSTRVGRSRHRGSSGSTRSANSRTTNTSTPLRNGTGTALAINPLDPKATPHVRIRERSPTPPPVNAKPYIFEFEVEDTGPGIPEHMQDKIFEPFVQGDLGLNKKFGGTGLGLSICSQLAKLMGGSITLRSTVGFGSTFTMQIPLKYVKDRPPSTASSSTGSRPTSLRSVVGEGPRSSLNGSASPLQDPKSKSSPSLIDNKLPRLVGLSAPFFAAKPNSSASKVDQTAAIDKAMANKTGNGKLRVLVADDNATNVEVVSRMLKLEDVYDVAIAKDGQEAYELVKASMEKNQRFDVIFMDIQMPNVDGLQSTRLIRKMGYVAPIVALTAFSEESNVKECIESGMDEFLSKPIRRPALKKVLKKFVTIPEEPETTNGSTKEKGTGSDTITANGTATGLNGNANGNANGIAHRKTKD
ncbi:histidine kinase [Trichoderma longibrachiatum ATCC 18648]|uniref:histidine kinase n=1 Tax=Trichoderma longibrachiatum ATCC 18648 TaxID=983965 RepID=A0A2T4BS93_TRILO|nr:histidine kinase [Trichoderma longibrachiatum ATCC 18648]